MSVILSLRLVQKKGAGHTDKELFHHSMMTHFRKRFCKDTLAQINQLIVAAAMADRKADVSSDDGNNQSPSNQGKLLVGCGQECKLRGAFAGDHFIILDLDQLIGRFPEDPTEFELNGHFGLERG